MLQRAKFLVCAQAQGCAADALELGRRFFGAGSAQNVAMHVQDGCTFLQQSFGNYDAIILDVSMPTADATGDASDSGFAQHPMHHGAYEHQGPPSAFLTKDCLDGAVWRALSESAVLAVNVLGPPKHAQAVHDIVKRCDQAPGHSPAHDLAIHGNAYHIQKFIGAACYCIHVNTPMAAVH